MDHDQFEELIDTLVGIRQELSSIDDSICHAHREGLNLQPISISDIVWVQMDS